MKRKGGSRVSTPADQAAAGAARVYTVVAGEPFLDRLASAILSGDLPVPGGAAPGPLTLPDMTVLLPTRRAARALQEAFLRVSGRTAMLLPTIRPIAEGDEELSLITGIVNREMLAGPDDSMPLPISELQRRLALTELVLAWSAALRRGTPDSDTAIETMAAGARSPAQAQHLATELCRLMDMLETENVPIARLDGIVPEIYSTHWQQTLDFLRIITEAWPAYLRESGRISATDRRNRLILAEAARLAAHPPTAPVIVAGVTGSIPATGVLMRTVARLPQGAIVLPGLDKGLDGETLSALAQSPEHPQFGLLRLLASVGVPFEEVRYLPGAVVARSLQERLAFLHEAMRPAAATSHWHAYARETDKAGVASALEGISLIEAPSALDEAEAVALILRHAAETPGQTAALVSPDRLLARRVAVRLGAWGIRVDDSAGRPFAKTIPGTFLDLTIDAATTGFAPAPLMSLLKHPLTRLGFTVGEARRAARTLELAAFRTAYLGRGIDGVEAALERANREAQPGGPRRQRAVRRMGEKSWQSARDLVARLKIAFEPLLAALRTDAALPLRDLARAHLSVAENLARLGDPDAPNPLWDQEAGLAATTFFASLLDESLRAPHIQARDYAELYRSLVAKETVRTRVPVHPRLFIWGPYEARLQQPDVVILGSLNDGTWPEPADPGPWLNRPMRQELGLPSPEEEIGRSAHDFLSLMGARRIYMTRSKKIDGVPTVPSRWLMRINALLGGMGLADVLRPGEPWLGWARWRDEVLRPQSMRPPAPKPPVALRPRKISVSGAEAWIANPYAVYAQYVLKLDALPSLGHQPDASLRGSIVHDALGRFAAAYPDRLPSDVEAVLCRIIGEVMADHASHPRVAAFWLPRLERFARWFTATEPARRADTAKVLSETSGALVLVTPGGPFTLTARADRIDIGRDGVTITDYKTGSNLASLVSRALQGLAPQLPLEAAIAAGGGFPHVAALPVVALKYISASGGEPAGDERILKPKTGDVAALAQQALDGLKRLVELYDDPETPYRAIRRAGFIYDYDDYAQLARVKEWSVEGGEEAEGQPS
jgi:ATP-dependent helicase/nuclease subunit B